jgi:hypothetical protein
MIVKKPSNIVHSLNPVRFHISEIGKGNHIILNVVDLTEGSQGDIFIFDGTYFPDNNKNVSFNISEILNTTVSSNDIYCEELIYPITRMTSDIFVWIREYDEQNNLIGLVQYFTFKCLYGGVSNKALRCLHSINQTIFEYRLMNHEKQFLFTTRTNSRTIRLRESELYPFCFIMPAGDIQIRTQCGMVLDIDHSLPAGSIAALNPKMILKYFYEQYKETVSLFGLFLNKKYIFSISIIPSALSTNRLILRFRNSLGCYEQIEVTGRAEHAPEFDEEQLYGVYDPVTEDFVENRFRRSYNDVIKASVGYKLPDELNFIRELLSSDDVYLIDEDIEKLKVNVSAENFTMKLNPFEPQTVNVTIRVADREQLITPTFNYTDEDIQYPIGLFELGYLYEEGVLLKHSIIRSTP